MKTTSINRQLTLGVFVVVLLVAAIFIGLREDRAAQASSDIVRPLDATRTSGHGSGASISARQRDGQKRQRPESDTAAESRLRSLLDAGELGAVHDELTLLAESKRLESVGDVLTQWCRTGSLELAQWAIVLSGDSDAELNLTLCADALSNPSEIIRELAAARLEEVSGTRFSTTLDARSWLKSRTPE